MKNENDIFVHDRKQIKTIKYYIKRLFLPLFDVFYKLILFLNWRKIKKDTISNKKKYSFSICAIFKDEELSLKEWVEYHRLVGVDHFYLYNNLSTDNYKVILEPYIEEGIVDLIDWILPPPSQFPAYEDCFNKYRTETQWITFIDLDEYICPFYELTIKDWISKYEMYPSVLLYWKMFGTSGLIEHDSNKLITEQYFICWEKFDDVGKVCFNTSFEVEDITNHHLMHAKVAFLWGKIVIPPINEFYLFIRNGIHRVGFNRIEDFTIQLNHYWSKSYSLYLTNKILRGDVNNHIRNTDFFYLHEKHNKSFDYKIWRYMIKLKIAMGKDNGIHQNNERQIIK